MEPIIIVVHVIAAIGIIGLVLIQHGKGADMGASFGSGSSQTVFGSLGVGNVLTKSTTILAIIFFVTSLSLAVLARQAANSSLQDNSLIGDIDQVNAEITADAEAAFLDNLAELTEPADADVPVIETVLGDLPVIDVDQLVNDLPIIENDVPVVESTEE